jgi:tRNA pseudouridine55 synthase
VTSYAEGADPRSGLALLRKPEGITSFQALSPIKRVLSSGKVGHAGTLDRFANGLLIVLAGSYSRLASYVMTGEKLYRGLIAFGSETSTLDPEGEVIAEAEAPSLANLESALSKFKGSILQTPPAYSAVHVGGARAYELALRGKAPELKERRVEIFELSLLAYEGSEAYVEVRCSSGTYIRSLARDIAVACGSRAHLSALSRLAIGPFRVESAFDPGAFDPKLNLRELTPTEAGGIGLRAYSLLDNEMADRFSNGGRISTGYVEVLDGGGEPDGQVAAVFDRTNRLLGVAHIESERLVYEVVIPRPSGGLR